MQQIIPDFFIVGAPRSGTTWMHEHLNLHPEICMSRSKEPHYFGSDLMFDERVRRPTTEVEYLDLFAGCSSFRRVGEASVWYLYSEDAPDEMREFNPGCSIIISLRNPVDVVYSQYRWQLYRGDEVLTSFAGALRAEEGRSQGLEVPSSARFTFGLLYSRIGHYMGDVERYVRAFGEDRILIVLLDDIARDPGEVYGEICRFLGVDSGFRPAFRVVNRRRTVRSGWVRDKWRDPPHVVRRVGRLLPEGVRRAVGRSILSWNARVEKGENDMDPELRRALRREFAADVEELRSLLGRELEEG